VGGGGGGGGGGLIVEGCRAMKNARINSRKGEEKNILKRKDLMRLSGGRGKSRHAQGRGENMKNFSLRSS